MNAVCLCVFGDETETVDRARLELTTVKVGLVRFFELVAFGVSVG